MCSGVALLFKVLKLLHPTCVKYRIVFALWFVLEETLIFTFNDNAILLCRTVYVSFLYTSFVKANVKAKDEALQGK